MRNVCSFFGVHSFIIRFTYSAQKGILFNPNCINKQKKKHHCTKSTYGNHLKEFSSRDLFAFAMCFIASNSRKQNVWCQYFVILLINLVEKFWFQWEYYFFTEGCKNFCIFFCWTHFWCKFSASFYTGFTLDQAIPYQKHALKSTILIYFHTSFFSPHCSEIVHISHYVNTVKVHLAKKWAKRFASLIISHCVLQIVYTICIHYFNKFSRMTT